VPLDLVVIGGGPAGEKAAAAAAFFGKRVALVDASPDGPGGAAVHTGTLPSKTLRESALYLTGLRRRGLDAAILARRLDSARELTTRLSTVCELQTRQIRNNLNRHGIRLVTARGVLVDAHHVQAGAEVLEAEYILIATGSSPRRPASFDFTDPEVFDSDTILKLDRIPESLAVIGGGVIGSEYACVFAALGSSITLIESGPRVLGFLDEEISSALMASMREHGITLRLNDSVQSLQRRGNDLVATLKSGATETFDRVLVSAGRTGNTAGLNLERAGVTLDERGLVVVDKTFRTSSPGIFAAGDVVGRPALASSAMEQGRVAVAAMFGVHVPERDWRSLPAGIYTIPEACACGPTEAELTASGIPYVAGRSYMRHNERGQIIGDMDGFVKLLFHRETRALLATHLICERATELIHIGQAVMRLGGGIDYFIETVLTYPSLSAAYKMAAYDALGQLSAGAGRPAPLD
jgi:NAD(P) transhydrogenase